MLKLAETNSWSFFLWISIAEIQRMWVCFLFNKREKIVSRAKLLQLIDCATSIIMLACYPKQKIFLLTWPYKNKHPCNKALVTQYNWMDWMNISFFIFFIFFLFCFSTCLIYFWYYIWLWVCGQCFVNLFFVLICIGYKVFLPYSCRLRDKTVIIFNSRLANQIVFFASIITKQERSAIISNEWKQYFLWYLFFTL